ncbi:hypothetical protein JCM10213_005617 [Rhodosporidiobolus nylandii]
MNLPLAAHAPACPPPSSANAPAVPSLQLLRRLEGFERTIDDATKTISGLLADLLQCSRDRADCVARLEQIRVERQRLLKEELAGGLEMREVYSRAEDEGIDVAMLSVGEMDGRVKGEGSETSNGQEVEREERAQLLGRQLLYLTHCTRLSESRVSALLATLESSRSSLVFRAAFNELQVLIQQLSIKLERLTLDRERLSGELANREGDRAQVEERRGEVVLDLVLEWDAEKRWKREEKQRHGRDVADS